MAFPQTSVAAQAVALAGQLADTDAGVRVESRINEEASAEMPFGTMVILGSTSEDVGALKLHTSSAVSAPLLAGIIVRDYSYANDTELGSTGLKPGVTLNVLRRGHIWVTTEDACDPGDTVKVRAVASGGEVAGAFRVAADGTDCVDISKFARWLTSAGAGGLAKLEIDMVGSAQATADT